MSTLARWHKEDMGVSHKHLPQGTAKHHPCWHRYQEQTLNPRQHRWNRLNACGYNMQSSGTHDTPRSIQKDSHSWQASSASSHVIWRSRQRMVLHDREDFSVFRRDHLLHTQCRTCIRSSDGHLCTRHTLDCVEGRGSSLHHQGECSALHPLYLIQSKKNINNNYSLKFCQHAKLKELCHEIQPN